MSSRNRSKPKYHIIPIEVPEHVAAYFKSKSNGRIKVGRSDFIGSVLLLVLEPMPFGARPRVKKPGRHYVDLAINSFYTDRRRHLPEKHLPDVKSLLRQRYKADFEREVDRLVFFSRMPKTEAIRIFREKNGISEEMFPFESSYRAYLRHVNGK